MPLSPIVLSCTDLSMLILQEFIVWIDADLSDSESAATVKIKRLPIFNVGNSQARTTYMSYFAQQFFAYYNSLVYSSTFPAFFIVSSATAYAMGTYRHFSESGPQPVRKRPATCKSYSFRCSI